MLLILHLFLPGGQRRADLYAEYPPGNAGPQDLRQDFRRTRQGSTHAEGRILPRRDRAGPFRREVRICRRKPQQRRFQAVAAHTWQRLAQGYGRAPENVGNRE